MLKEVEQQPERPAERSKWLVVKKKAENGLAGDIIKNAGVARDNLGKPQIEFTLTKDGGMRFGEVTRNNIGHRLAIVLDGELAFRAEHPERD